MTENLTFNDLPNAVTKLTKEISELKALLTKKQEEKRKDPTEKLLSVQETAKFLNLSIPTIYSKVSRRELPFMKRGKRLYFSSIDLLNYLKEGKVKSNSEIEAEATLYLLNNKTGGNDKL